MKSTLLGHLEKLLNAYSHLYDIARDVTVDGQNFPATATYYLRDENYLISKKHVLSAVEQHEYVYFHLTSQLEKHELQTMIDAARQDGLRKVHPSKEHMFSYITLIVLADTIDPEALRLIRKTRIRKNYLLTLHGWMEFRLAAMETSSNRFFSNPAGRETKKILVSNFLSGSRSQTPLRRKKYERSN